MDLMGVRVVRCLLVAGGLLTAMIVDATAQSSPPASTTPSTSPSVPPKAEPATPKAEPATPKSSPPSSTPPTTGTPTPATPSTKTPAPATKAPDAMPETTTPGSKPDTGTSTGKPDTGASPGKPGNTEIEPHGSPGIPQNATTESVNVPARPAVIVPGQSSYDDAFKSIHASFEEVKKAMDKAGLKPSGHPITIFSEPDDKGFKYKLAVPIAAKPDGKVDLGSATIGETPSGKAIKFQHRGAYEDIDSTYDVITAYLDAKGLQAENPYIEEYLNDLTTGDDPNLQVDIYVFVKK